METIEYPVERKISADEEALMEQVEPSLEESIDDDSNEDLFEDFLEGDSNHLLD